MIAEVNEADGIWSARVCGEHGGWAFVGVTEECTHKVAALMALSDLRDRISKAVDDLIARENVADLSASAEEAVLIANGTEALPERFTLTEEDGILVQGESKGE